MWWIVVRIGGAIASALGQSFLIYQDISSQENPAWHPWAMGIAFVLFVGFVSWGWVMAEYELRKRRRIEKHLTKLSALRQTGAEFLNEGLRDITTDGAIRRWWERVARWQEDVERVMRQVHPADPANWRTLGTFSLRAFDGVNNDDLLHKLSMLAERLEKLERYIEDRAKK